MGKVLPCRSAAIQKRTAALEIGRARLVVLQSSSWRHFFGLHSFPCSHSYCGLDVQARFGTTGAVMRKLNSTAAVWRGLPQVMLHCCTRSVHPLAQVVLTLSSLLDFTLCVSTTIAISKVNNDSSTCFEPSSDSGIARTVLTYQLVLPDQAISGLRESIHASRSFRD